MNDFSNFQPKTDECSQKNIRVYYVAPEILRSSVMYEPLPCADVYSFAILLQEIFTREDPYHEITDIMPTNEIIEAIQVHSLRPVHNDLTPLKIKQIMEIAWGDEMTSRPTFDQILKMLKNAHPGRKSVLDHMIDVMEEYSHELEASVEEKVFELEITRKQFTDLMLTFLPPYATQQLIEGQTVSPITLQRATLMKLKIVGLGSDVCATDLSELLRLLAEIINLVDETLARYNCIKISCDRDVMLCIGELSDVRVSQNVVNMASLARDLVSAVHEWSVMSRWPVTIRAAIHLGHVTVMVLDTKVPLLTAVGKGIDELHLVYKKAISNTVLVSPVAHKLLVATEKFSFRKNDLGEGDTYWMDLPEHGPRTSTDEQVTSSDKWECSLVPTSQSVPSVTSQSPVNSVTNGHNHQRPSSRTSSSSTLSLSSAALDSALHPDTEVQQSTYQLLSEPDSPSTIAQVGCDGVLLNCPTLRNIHPTNIIEKSNNMSGLTEIFIQC